MISCGCRIYPNHRDDLERRLATGMKTCTVCGETQPFSEFARTQSSKSKDGFRSRCKQCDTAAYRQRKYGISREAFAAMLAEQDYSCAACGVPVDESSPLDHCHLSGQVRAILCFDCNTTLGRFNEDARRLQGLLTYLKVTRQLKLFPMGRGPIAGDACQPMC
jgi:hypothetical protein